MSNHTTKFGGHSHSGSGVKILVCHVIKESCDVISGSPPSRKVTTWPSLVAIDIVVVEIKSYFRK